MKTRGEGRDEAELYSPAFLVNRRRDGDVQQPQTARDNGTDTAAGTDTINTTGQGTRPCKAWLLGHSYIHWAAQRDTFHRADGQLGFQQTQVQLQVDQQEGA
ncbi:uncharacterized protein LOC108700036 isoform X3 [Xenopus laevis]|uniref:Uncharacterized protein LOC108700036 isoform X3 n=1 Tax=Xenopus laevis TaxID=8355 RepID=A0A8J1LMF3_XENLA|nr:uncharacterized protein LOC108700036 isoform X3 [Xenopus laevis]